MKHNRLLIFLITITVLSSCATIRHGSKQTILINSIPQGAEVRINNSLMGVTPIEVKVRRARKLFIEYTHPEFGTQLYLAPRNIIKKRLIPDLPYWIGAFNPILLTDLLTGATLEFDQTKLTPELSNPNLFVSKANTLNELKDIERIERKIVQDSIAIARLLLKEELARQDSLEVLRKKALHLARKENQLHIRYTLKNEFSWQLSALAVRELDFSYLRYILKSQVGVGIELGYKPELASNKNYENINKLNINGPTEGIMLMPFTESKYVGLVSKFYLEKKSPLNFYISFVGFYRESSYSNATIKWDDQVDKSKTRYSSEHYV